MSLCTHVHPAQHLLGTHSVFSVPHSRGQDPAICSAGGMSFKSDDWGQSISWAQGHSVVHRGSWTVVSPSLPSRRERDLGRISLKVLGAPRCDHRETTFRAMSGETQRQTAGANQVQLCPEPSSHELSLYINPTNSFALPPL